MSDVMSLVGFSYSCLSSHSTLNSIIKPISLKTRSLRNVSLSESFSYSLWPQNDIPGIQCSLHLPNQPMADVPPALSSPAPAQSTHEYSPPLLCLTKCCPCFRASVLLPLWSLAWTAQPSSPLLTLNTQCTLTRLQANMTYFYFLVHFNNLNTETVFKWLQIISTVFWLS